MSATAKTAKVSSGEVRIEPVNDVAGSLTRYARRKKKIPFRVARERAWETVVREKHKRR